MTEPNDKQQEEAREPERIKVCIRPGKDDWIGVAYSVTAGDPSAIHEYVPASLLPSRDTEICKVLEGLRTGDCWCPSGQLMEHSPACLATQTLWNKLQPVKEKDD